MNKTALLMMLNDKLNSDDLALISTKLDENKDYSNMALINFKSSLLGLVLGFFLGVLAVVRFYKGDIVLGIIKIFVNPFTFGLWRLIDLFLVYRGNKKDNFKKVLTFI